VNRSIFAPLIAIAVMVGVVIGANQLFFGTPTGYKVRAVFADAQGVSSKARVEIRGIQAGLVSGVRVNRSRTAAIVTMALDHGAGHIGPNASATIRPASLLGEEFIDLKPGSTTRSLPSNSTIPESRTSTAVSINDVINTFQPGVRARLRILINEAGTALDGQGANFNSLLGELPPSLNQMGKLLNQIGADNHTLSSLIVHSSHVISSMTQSRSHLDELVSSAAQALQTVAARRTQLADTVRQAPATLAQLTSTLTQLQSAAAQLEPTATELTAAAPSLATTLEALPAFASASRPTLNEAQTVAPALVRLGDQGVGPIRSLQPTADDLSSFGTQLAPNVETLAGGAMTDLLNLTNGWAKSIQDRDGLGHVFREQAVINQDLLRGPILNLLAGSKSSSTPSTAAQHANRSAQRTNAGVTNRRHHHHHRAHARPSRGPAYATSTGSTSSSASATSSQPSGGLAGVLGAVGQGLEHLTGALTGASSASSKPATGGLSRLLGYLLSP
jgi:phospholipid/cholesterol/gamma-HCH transport system substrate-binding protein